MIVDARTGAITAARDPMGICPLYWGRSKSGALWFASEMKAIQHQCDDWLTFFPPVRGRCPEHDSSHMAGSDLKWPPC